MESQNSNAIQITNQTNLINWDKVKQAIEEAKSIDEVKQFRDSSETLLVYVKKQKASLGILNQVAEINIRSERRLGEITKEIPKMQGSRTDLTSPPEAGKSQALKNAGLTSQEVSKYEALANIPEADFEKHIAHIKESNEELTTYEMLLLARELRIKEVEASPIDSDIIVVSPRKSVREKYYPSDFSDPEMAAQVQILNDDALASAEKEILFAADNLCRALKPMPLNHFATIGANNVRNKLRKTQKEIEIYVTAGLN